VSAVPVSTLDKPSLDRLDQLAIADPDHDPVRDFYLQRLDAAVPSVFARLRARLGPRPFRELDRQLDLYTALPTPTRREVVAHPYFSYWWLKLMERCVSMDRGAVERWLGHFSRFLLVPALVNGTWDGAPLPVAASRGEVRLPGHLRHLRLAQGDELVVVSASNGTLAVETSGGVQRLPVSDLLGPQAPSSGSPVRQRAALAGAGIEVDAGEPFVRLLFDDLNARPAEDGYGPRDLALMDPLPERVLPCFQLAVALLDRCWPAAATEVCTYTRVIVPYTSQVSSTFTEAAFMGAVFMAEARQPFSSAFYTAEHLLHESSHLRLTLVMEVDRLASWDPEATFESPWRRDRRPMMGLVQGAFVFARIARFMALGAEATGEERFEQRRSEVVADLQRALEVIGDDRNAIWTPLGRSLLEQMRQAAAPGSG
jgi:HEXXH motif-containing protein